MKWRLIYVLIAVITFTISNCVLTQVPDGTKPEIKHFVPTEKGLSPGWIKSLYKKGEPEKYQGEALDQIGMPCGGIGAGQLYLRGDGTLWCWRLFNGMPDTDVYQGFAVIVENEGATVLKRLNRKDFPEAEFRGEYPIGTINYRAEGFPVEITMEAFTPFIPLNSTDSRLPATIFSITVRNNTYKPVKASIAGWLENAVCRHASKEVIAMRHSRIVQDKGRSVIIHTAEKWTPKASAQPRDVVVLQDFEGENYGEWKTTGNAFGTKPVSGRDPTAGSFKGKGLVDTYIPSQDGPTGTLTSPEFVISRQFMNFLISGGAYEGKTCMNLIIDGKIVRTVMGRNTEQLVPRSWDIVEFEGKKATIQIVDEVAGGWGHINIDQIEMADIPSSSAIEALPDYGTMAFALAEPADSTENMKKYLTSLKEPEEINVAPDISYPIGKRISSGIMPPMITLGPKGEKTFIFVLTWHFPNHPNGHVYASTFADANAVASYILDNKDRLISDTKKWRDTYYDSTMPVWLLDRLQMPASTLSTDTCEWWKNGRFWAYEGVGCCHGTCSHVWNYEHAMARLFPEIERSVREVQDVGVAWHEDGVIGHRGENSTYVADGQAGTILKFYREHQTSADAEFLKRNYPKIKKALEYLIIQDANDDGLIENSQPNTYDIEFFGANTFVGSLYLGALRAGEEMAIEMNDAEFAAKTRKIFESGKKLSVERLYNGEYFIQTVDLAKYPNNQYATGCLADQLFGQGWAHQVGLGYIYPQPNVKSALVSIWRYNWAPTIAAQNEAHPPERWFLFPNEPGLFICTWPKSTHLGGGSVRYRDEVWTGIEYQVAGNMVWDGMLDEALVIVRAAHERYSPEKKRNPYNEVECGGHYARAMASWGVFTALSGFEYHGPKGYIGFAPKLSPENFRSAFTAAEGWGTFSQTREGATQKENILVKWGRLRVKTMAFALPPNTTPSTVAITVGPNAVNSTHKVENGRIMITLANEAVVNAGQSIEVTTK